MLLSDDLRDALVSFFVVLVLNYVPDRYALVTTSSQVLFRCGLPST